MQTLLLDRTTNDLCLDSSGNIAVASNPYALAQDAASAVKTFQGEVWYDTTQGVPYFANILGQAPSLPYMKAQFVAAALTVPEVVAAVCYLDGLKGRTLTGQIQVTDTTGTVTVAAFGRAAQESAVWQVDTSELAAGRPKAIWQPVAGTPTESWNP